MRRHSTHRLQTPNLDTLRLSYKLESPQLVPLTFTGGEFKIEPVG
jgi:hypothetical protein